MFDIRLISDANLVLYRTNRDLWGSFSLNFRKILYYAKVFDRHFERAFVCSQLFQKIISRQVYNVYTGPVAENIADKNNIPGWLLLNVIKLS